MDILRHSMDWVRGELVEMTLITAAGFFVGACALALWGLGSTPLARALVVPLAAVGLFYAALGVGGVVSNQRRIVAFERAASTDAAAFARAEKARVATFGAMYAVTNVVAPLCFAEAALLFWLSVGPQQRSIAIALVIFGLFGFVIDGFSSERATEYDLRIEGVLRR